MPESKIALLSIYPEYAEAIFAGLKTVEFRKRSFKEGVNTVLIYACRPVMGLVGYFYIDTINETTPELAWKRYGRRGYINQEDYTAYYSGSDKAIAIQIKEAVKFINPVGLSVIGKNIKPPQSYRYIHSDLFNGILKRANKHPKAGAERLISLSAKSTPQEQAITAQLQ